MQSRKHVGFNPDRLAERDPFGLKDKHPGADHRTFYKICMGIPVLLSFGLVFYLISLMSPRGDTMQNF